MCPTIQVTIQNKKGLHARAAAKFVRALEPFDAMVEVRRAASSSEGADAEHAGPVGGTSLLGLMMLGADKGTVLELKGDGADADRALEALRNLVDSLFDEGE